MKKINKKISVIFITIAIFQIFLLMNVTVANSYFLGDYSKKVEKEIAKQKDQNDLLDLGLDFLISFFTIKQIGIVSAVEDLGVSCCIKDKGGNVCQNMLNIDLEEKCDEWVDNSCGEVGQCREGCCVDDYYGTCNSRTSVKACDGDNEEWKSSAECSIEECNMGCCVLGDHVELTTSQECTFISQSENKQKDWRGDSNHDTWQECMLVLEDYTEIPCITSQGVCEYILNVDCIRGGGIPLDGLCSDEEKEEAYGYDYEKHSYKDCDGEDIYWFDDQGNREEIAQNCVDNEQECAINNQGQPYCKDLGCIDPFFRAKYNRNPKNGESWCIYEGYTGLYEDDYSYRKVDDRDDEHYKTRTFVDESFGADAVGSMHWRAECFKGEINGGGDYTYSLGGGGGEYRGYLCSEQKIQEPNSNDFFITAVTTVNGAQECLLNNPLAEDDGAPIASRIKACSDHPNCFIKNITAIDPGYADDDSFEFQMCLPKYPKGQTQMDGEDENMCDMINEIVCPVVYSKDGWGHWECRSNCECESEGYMKQMSDLCVSLGDCGSYFNYLGATTDNSYYLHKRGFSLDGDGNEKNGQDGRDYEESDYSGCDGGVNDEDPGSNADCKNILASSYKSELQGKKSERVEIYLDRIAALMGIDGEVPDVNDPNYGDFIQKMNDKIGQIPGAFGGAFLFLPSSWFTSAAAAASTPSTLGGTGVVAGISLGSVAIAAASVAIGVGVGYAVAKVLGLSAPATIATGIAGGLGGLGVGLAKLGLLLSTGTAVLIAVIAIAVVALWGFFTGWGSAETRYVEFHCNAWQPPTQNYDCSVCNDNPLFPCTQYKCESIGALCYVPTGSENQENPPCLKRVYESVAPRITIAESPTGCINQGNSFRFVIETDEYARCKYSKINTDFPRDLDGDGYKEFEEMEGELFLEGPEWSQEFNLEYVAPRVDSLPSNQITGSIPNRRGSEKIYIRCMDPQDPTNINPTEKVINICINERDTDPPEIVQFIPESGRNLRFGITEADVKFWVNEPANCKYDLRSGTDYSEMPYSISCKNGLDDKSPTFGGWPCNVTFTDLTTVNNYYIKCKDQPWYNGTNESLRHTNNQDFHYKVSIAESDLLIRDISFSYTDPEGRTKSVNSGGTIKAGGINYIPINIELVTSEGFNNGLAKCAWSTPGASQDMMEPYDQFARVHEKRLSSRGEGTYINNFECFDEAGNIVEAEANFTVDIDREHPIIIENITEGNNLRLITDEDANCYVQVNEFYDENLCYFEFDSNESAHITNVGFDTEHIIPNKDPRLNYYVQCEDVYENKGCAGIIKATEQNDGLGPVIVRVFKDDVGDPGTGTGNLKIITNKPAKCYYHPGSCDFELKEENLMAQGSGFGGFATEHYAYWDQDIIYHIRCKDAWNNPKLSTACQMIVKPSDLE